LALRESATVALFPGTRTSWSVLLASFAILALYRAVSSSFSILVLPLEAELSTTRASVTLIFTAHMMVYAAASPASGVIVSWLGPYRTIALGAIFVGSSLCLMVTSRELIDFIVTFGLLGGIGMALTGLPANFAILSSQFAGRVATAMGIAGAGMGVGVLLIVPMIQWTADRIGWRQAFLWAGLAISGAMLLAVMLARSASQHPQVLPKSADAERARIGTILGMGVWRQFALANFMMGAALFGLLTHQVAIVQAAGWSAVSAATTLGIVNLLRSLSGPCWGAALDRYGTASVYSISTGLCLCGLAVLIALPALPDSTGVLVVAFALAFGIGAAGSLPTNASVAAKLFAPAQRAIAWGLTDAAYAGGAAFGAWGVGWFFDISGDYVGALIFVAALFGWAYLMIRALARYVEPHDSSVEKVG
jgi:MFS family permease